MLTGCNYIPLFLNFKFFILLGSGIMARENGCGSRGRGHGENTGRDNNVTSMLTKNLGQN